MDGIRGTRYHAAPVAPTIPTVPVGDPPFAPTARRPGLLLAWAPPGVTGDERRAVGVSLEIGRVADGWPITDEQMSGRHFVVRPFGEGLLVEDLGSTNGTFLDGIRLERGAALEPGSIVRAGRCLFVAHPDLQALESRLPLPEGMAGRFHGPALVRDLQVASLTGRHVLLVGDSGTGKELCANWLADALRRGGRLVAHNCARFTSAEEAEATLFGVGRGVFSGVEARTGLLEDAAAGVLFLDELHALPVRVQRSLLRFAEDGLHARIGSTDTRPLDTRLVFGTNVPLGTDELAPDLVARLHVVPVPALEDRRADVPEIFLHALRRAAAARSTSSAALEGALGADHFEALCVADHEGTNVRALEALAHEIVARVVASGGDAAGALRQSFGDRFGESAIARRGVTAPKSPGSLYETNRDRIVAAYWAARANLSETERALRADGIAVNRKWLAEFLRRWGVR